MQSIKDMFHGVTEYFFPERTSFWQRNKYYIVGGSLVVLVGAGFYGYRMYMTQRNTEAFGVLGRYIERFLGEKKGGARLDDGALQLEAQAFSGSAASPYFTAYEAQNLLHQGKIAEAEPLLEKAVNAMPSSSPLTDLYKVKLALVRLDSGDQTMVEKGLKSLQALACSEQTSPAWDVAVYYLGRYHWVKGNVEEAKKIWMDALASVEKMTIPDVAKRYGESPWLERAKQAMKSVI
jgi:hypothetical protein